MNSPQTVIILDVLKGTIKNTYVYMYKFPTGSPDGGLSS